MSEDKLLFIATIGATLAGVGITASGLIAAQSHEEAAGRFIAIARNRWPIADGFGDHSKITTRVPVSPELLLAFLNSFDPDYAEPQDTETMTALRLKFEELTEWLYHPGVPEEVSND